MLFTHVTRTVLVGSLFVAQDLLFIMNATEANCMIILFAIYVSNVLGVGCRVELGWPGVYGASHMSNTTYEH